MKPRRWPLVVLVIAAAALILALTHARWLAVHLSEELGISTQASRAYDFWSGLAPNIRDVIELPLIASIWWLHHRCHAERCNRVGHPMPAGYLLCKHHAGQPRAALGLHEIHPDHR